MRLAAVALVLRHRDRRRAATRAVRALRPAVRGRQPELGLGRTRSGEPAPSPRRRGFGQPFSITSYGSLVGCDPAREQAQRLKQQGASYAVVWYRWSGCGGDAPAWLEHRFAWNGGGFDWCSTPLRDAILAAQDVVVHVHAGR